MANFENVITVCRKCFHLSGKEKLVSVNEDFAVFEVLQIFFFLVCLLCFLL